MKLEPTAVEEWAKEFERCKKRQLTKEEVSMVINATFNEELINKDQEVLDLLEGKASDCYGYCSVQANKFSL